MNIVLGFPGGSVVKNLLANTGDSALIPGWGRSPGGGHGNPLQHPCLENAMDRGAWWGYRPHGRRVGHNSATKQQQKEIKGKECDVCIKELKRW